MGDKATLVAQVKEWQRMSDGHKQSWYNFLLRQGTSKYDPNRHEVDLLQTFITEAHAGRIDVSEAAVNPTQPAAMGDKEALVAQVKEWQRTSAGHKQSWDNFLMKQGTSVFDPNRHEVDLLETFITEAHAGRIEVDANAVPKERKWTSSGDSGNWGGGGGDWSSWGGMGGVGGMGGWGGWGGMPGWDPTMMMMAMKGGKGGGLAAWGGKGGGKAGDMRYAPY